MGGPLTELGSSRKSLTGSLEGLAGSLEGLTGSLEGLTGSLQGVTGRWEDLGALRSLGALAPLLLTSNGLIGIMRPSNTPC